MTSTRLPGKVMLEVEGRPLLQYQIERVRNSRLISGLIIATTTNREDDVIVRLCKNMDVPVFRGSEHNVLSRYWGASQLRPTSHCIRITSDCPLLDPKVLDLCIEQYLAGDFDYFSNSPAFPNGMNVEIFPTEYLKLANDRAQLPYEMEHVTPYFYTRPNEFRIGSAVAPRAYPAYRLTVDTPEDFRLISTLLKRLLPTKLKFTLEDICQEFEGDPSLKDINSHVRQKKFDE